jgi:hypothetical protein
MMSHCGAVTKSKLIEAAFPYWTVAHVELSHSSDSTSTIDFALHSLQLRLVIKSSPEAISRVRAAQFVSLFRSLSGPGPPTREFWAE